MGRTSRTQKKFSLKELLTSDEVLESLSTRDTLLAHGVRLFHRYGAHGTSITKLLEVSGKSKSQFYRHFHDKDDFVCAVLDLEMSTMLRLSRRNRFDSIEDIDEWFSLYVELAHLPDNLGCPVGPIATELSPSSPKVREEAARQFKRWEQYLDDMLTLLAARERFDREFSPTEVAQRLAYSIQGAFMMGRVFQTDRAILAVRESLREELLSWRRADEA